MLDLKYITTCSAQVESSLKKREAHSLLPTLQIVIDKDKKRRAIIQEVEGLKQLRNQTSNEIAALKQKKTDATELLEKMKIVSQQIKGLDTDLSSLMDEINQLLFELPNELEEMVPIGKSSLDNVEIRRVGEIPQFDFDPKSHDDIGESLKILDFKKAGDVSGARFVFLKGLGVRLSMALTQFMLHEHTKVGYEEILPPFLVNQAALTGTGQLPKFAEDVFRIEKHDLYLIPTAEVPVTNYHSKEILNESELPKKYVAYSPCFRAEAGSYGKDTKGLKRQHQFEKVELVKFVTKNQAEPELQSLVLDAESILKKLGLPYRVMLLCGADTGFSSAKTYDIEVWSPFLKQYIEISSCSHFSDFQARRAEIRYRESATQKVQFVHTLNGSGLAIGRTLLAILENYQNKDGSISIPKALNPWMHPVAN